MKHFLAATIGAALLAGPAAAGICEDFALDAGRAMVLRQMHYEPAAVAEVVNLTKYTITGTGHTLVNMVDAAWSWPIGQTHEERVSLVEAFHDAMLRDCRRGRR